MNLDTRLFFGLIVSIMATSLSELILALAKACKASSVEIRLDCFSKKMSEVLPQLAILLPEDKPVILTLRSKEQGGSIFISLEEQWQFWAGIPNNLQKLILDPESKVYVDWGLDLIRYSLLEKNRNLFPWQKIGASHHLMTEKPETLPNFLRELEKMPAQAFLKLVGFGFHSNDSEQVRMLFQNRLDSRPLIAFLMGEICKESRIDCLGWGSAGTFVCLDEQSRTAPGQFLLEELVIHSKVLETLTAKVMRV